MIVDDDTCDVFTQLGDLSQKYYISACEELSVKPIKNIHDGLIEDDLICKGTKLVTNDVKACAIALVVCLTKLASDTLLLNPLHHTAKPHSSVSSVQDLETGGHWFDPTESGNILCEN